MRMPVPFRPGRPARSERAAAGRALAAIAVPVLLAACGSTPLPPPPARPAPPPRPVAVDPNALPPSAAAALRQRFPALHAVGRSTGRFQVDDADDLAVVLAPQGNRGDHVVALLSNVRDNDWRLTGATTPLDPGCATCTVSADIAQHALFVHLARIDGAHHATITFQFAYRNNDDKPRLVAVNTYQADQAESSADALPHAYATSANLLTGRKMDELDDELDGQPRHRELLSSIPLRAPIPFDQFSLSAAGLEPETRRLPATAFDPDTPLPPAALAQLQARFPGMDVRGHATGELHAAGAKDIAVVMAPPGKRDLAGSSARANGAIIAVLLAQPDGGLALADASLPLAHACADCGVQVAIAQRLLTVQIVSGDAAGALTRGYQFACRPADGPGAGTPLRLVGTRVESFARAASGDTRRVVTTTNLVTGDRAETTTEASPGHPARSATRRSRVSLRPPVMLEAFSLDPAQLGPETRREAGRDVLPATN
ncbi:MAG: hypothetical protein ACTHL8_13740 [Burkholderiaceae bacterium]